jgi:spore germination protein KA
MYRNRAARSRRRQQIIDEQINAASNNLDELFLTEALEDNVALMQKLFTDVDTMQVRRIRSEKDGALQYALIFSDGVVDKDTIGKNIIKPLMTHEAAESGGDILDDLVSRVLKVPEAEKTNSVKSLVEAVCYGDTVLLADGIAQAVVIDTKQFQIRAVDEPESERSLTGPREGFTESLATNLSLLRRKVRTNELKLKMRVFGRRTQTKACVCYMDGLVNKSILAELQRRLDKVDIDGVLDSNYLNELIRDSRSIFRTTGYTERPDVVMGKLLEGRIAILVDGSPVALTVPYLFIENFQSSEDYYYSYYYTSFTRLLRILGFFLTVTVPGLYVAIVAFHHEMLPTQLLINVATERSSVPLPAALEAFLMLVVFDLLRETGARMPGNIGQALSIVGALVIGQAAVEAKLVAAPMIIVVALTGICALLVPKLNAPIIYVRFMLLLLASTFGFYGLALGASAVLIHIINLRTFGIQVLTLTGDLSKQEAKDTWVREPWWMMKLRPRMAADRVRMKGGEGK